MQSARSVGQGFFPLDEELELLPSRLTPKSFENLVRIGAWIPFRPAAQLLKALLGIEVSKASSVRAAETAGEAYVKAQEQEAERLEKELPEVEKNDEKMVVSVDGVYVPLVGGEWAEVKNLAIGVVQPPVKEGDEMVVHTDQLSYFSRLMEAEQFKKAASVELYRRKVEGYSNLAAVMDGAEWEQGFVDYHCPDAVRILDFPHAAQRVSPFGQALLGEDNPATQQWAHECLHHLKYEGGSKNSARLTGYPRKVP